jgi:hypothetical protein
MLAQHQVRLGQADILGPHDLEGLGVLEHAVLVDAALMREGVLADDGLVELHREAGDRRHRRLAAMILVVSMPVLYGMMSPRTAAPSPPLRARRCRPVRPSR